MKRKGKKTALGKYLKKKLPHKKKHGNQVNLNFDNIGHPFPPSVRTKMRTVGVMTLQSSGTGDGAVDCFWIANTAGHVKLFTAAAGASPPPAFINYPSGVAYLLGGQSGAGSAAPYGRAFVHGSSIKLKISTEGTGNKVLQCTLLPCYFPPGVAPIMQMSSQNLVEQEHAKSIIMPPVLNTKGVVMSNHVSTKTIFGLKHVCRDDVPYTTDGANDSFQPWFWLFRTSCVDATNLAAPYILIVEYEITNDCEFYDRNFLNSVAPAAGLGLGSTGSVGENDSGFHKAGGGNPAGYTGIAGSGDIDSGLSLPNSGFESWTAGS